MLHKLYRITFEIAESLTNTCATEEATGVENEKVFEGMMKFLFSQITEHHKNNYPMPLIEEWLSSIHASLKDQNENVEFSVAECKKYVEETARLFFKHYDNLCLPLIEKIQLEKAVSEPSNSNSPPLSPLKI